MEYEYSFKVSNIEEYINYCKKNNYKLTSEEEQIRTIYRNKNNMARITKNIVNGNTILKLDFKEDKLDNKDLIIRKESKSIIFDNEGNCEDILLYLEYKKDNTLNRIRYVYEKGNVKFEIDIYKEPTHAYVIAIEGEKEEVDKVYTKLEKLNSKYKI